MKVLVASLDQPSPRWWINFINRDRERDFIKWRNVTYTYNNYTGYAEFQDHNQYLLFVLEWS